MKRMTTNMKAVLLTAMILGLAGAEAIAQTGTAAPIVNQLTQYKTELLTVINAVGGLAAIYYGFGVYTAYSGGDTQYKEKMSRWLFGLAILGMLDVIIGFFI